MVTKGRILPLLAALLLVPAFLAQPSGELNEEIMATEGSDITFYGRTWNFGAGANMPMNTQYPWGEDDYSIGTSGGCGNIPPLPDDSADCDSWGSNEAWWYTTAGFVQVKSREEFTSYELLHNERGQTKDIYFDTDKAPQSTFYMSADAHGFFVILCDVGVPCWNWDPGYFPDWSIETTVYHANLGEWGGEPGDEPDLTSVRNGDDGVVLMAYGKTEPTDLSSFDATIPSPTCSGECQTVHPFTADLGWDPEFVASGGVVPFLNDIVVSFEWFQDTDGQRYITPQENWNINAGEDYPNSITFPVRNPLDVELVFPRFVHDKLVILSVLNTPWGSYDVDLESINIEIANAAGNVIEPTPANFQEFVDVSVAHSGHYDPINLTWIWDYQKDDLPAGEYSLTISADNFQGSYSTETVASFTIKKDGTGGSTTAAQSGILSFNNAQFESYQEGAGIDGDDPSTATGNTDKSESKGSPGFGALAMIAGLGAMLILRRKTE